MSTLAHELRHTAELRRQVAQRERALYGPILDDVQLLRRRGFGVHVEPGHPRKRFRVGNRLMDAKALSAIAARERRLIDPQPCPPTNPPPCEGES